MGHTEQSDLTALCGQMVIINMPHYKTQQNKWLQRTGGCASFVSWILDSRLGKGQICVSYFSPPLRFSLWMDVNLSKGQSFKSPDIQAHVCVMLVAGRAISLTTRPNTELPPAGIEPRLSYFCSVELFIIAIGPHRAVRSDCFVWPNGYYKHATLQNPTK